MRIRQPAAGSRDTRSRGPSQRVDSDGLGEPPSPSGDAQLAHLFRNMRAATRLTRAAIAQRLATTPATIEDLEMGAVTALPHWRETVRIVRTYCEMLRLDPEPLLWRIQQLLRAGETPSTRPTRPSGPPPPGPRKERPQARASRRSRRGARKVLWLAAPPAVVGALLYLASTVPGPFYRAIPLLPAAWEGPARAWLDAFVLYSAPRRDGFKWVDVGDPRLRKVDKLPTKPAPSPVASGAPR
jgi:DNA-binding XRE family transcriptional regulator